MGKCAISLFVGLPTSGGGGGGERDGTRREERRRRRGPLGEEGAYTKYFPFKAERDRGGEEEIKKEKEERQKGRVGERWRDFEKKEKDVIPSIETPRRSHGPRPTRSALVRGRALRNAEARDLTLRPFRSYGEIKSLPRQLLTMISTTRLLIRHMYKNYIYFACNSQNVFTVDISKFY